MRKLDNLFIIICSLRANLDDIVTLFNSNCFMIMSRSELEACMALFSDVDSAAARPRLRTSSLRGRGANQALSSNAKPVHPFMQQVFDLNANMRANVNAHDARTIAMATGSKNNKDN